MVFVDYSLLGGVGCGCSGFDAVGCKMYAEFIFDFLFAFVGVCMGFILGYLYYEYRNGVSE